MPGYPLPASVGDDADRLLLAGERLSSPKARRFDRRRSQCDPLRSYGLLRTGRSIARGLTLNMQVECVQVVRAYVTGDDRVHFPRFKRSRIWRRSMTSFGGTAGTAGGASRFTRFTRLTIMDACAWIQSMSCRMEPHTESSWWLSMRRITFRMTDPMTCCAPAMPMFADCSTMKPVLASFSGRMK